MSKISLDKAHRKTLGNPTSTLFTLYIIHKELLILHLVLVKVSFNLGLWNKITLFEFKTQAFHVLEEVHECQLTLQFTSTLTVACYVTIRMWEW